MKTYSTILLIGALALAMGGCSTAYQAQTPDAVYYSPSQNNSRYASSTNNRSNNNESTMADNNDPNSGSYVTYENGYNEGDAGSYSYLNDNAGYNTQAISLFDNPDNFYAYNSYMLGSPLMYNPYYLSPYSMGFGLGLSPYYGLYPSFGLGLGFSPFYGLYPSFGLGVGYPFGMMGGFYSPYYYPAYMMGYGYYGGGYGYGKLGNYTPRPASAYGPRGSANSRTYLGVGERTTTNGSAPVRTFGNARTGNVPNNSIYGRSPERVFTTNPNEHPENLNTNTRVEQKRPGILRMFQRNNNNNYVEPRRTNQEVYRPQQERTFNRPERSFEQAPRVEVSTPSPSFNNNSGSAPVRTFSPRGR